MPLQVVQVAAVTTQRDLSGARARIELNIGAQIYGNSRSMTLYHADAVMSGNSIVRNNGIHAGEIAWNINFPGTGIHMRNSVLEMRDMSSVSFNSNYAAGSATTNGGGIWADTTATLHMYNFSSINDNGAGASGGGVWSRGIINMRGNSSITHNTAHHQVGGGIHHYGTVVNMFDTALVAHNAANMANAGGISLTASPSAPVGTVVSLNMFNNATIYDNFAAVNGGGVTVGVALGNGVVQMYMHDNSRVIGSRTSMNSASSIGGGIAMLNSANGGSTLTLNDNALIADNHSL